MKPGRLPFLILSNQQKTIFPSLRSCAKWSQLSRSIQSSNVISFLPVIKMVSQDYCSTFNRSISTASTISLNALKYYKLEEIPPRIIPSTMNKFITYTSPPSSQVRIMTGQLISSCERPFMSWNRPLHGLASGKCLLHKCK